ncbi:MAG TPA: pantoate--beta-alanine ligase, partial [Gammaproteobacteria bacterium]
TLLRDGSKDFAGVQRQALHRLEEGGFTPDYVEVREADTLAPASADDKRLVVLAAAWLGKARLIDNLSLDLGLPQDKTVVLSQPEVVG